MIRNLFKRIAEFFTGSSSDEDASAIPFAELSRKKAAELSKKERAERQHRNREKKPTGPQTEKGRPKRAAHKPAEDAKPVKKSPATRQGRPQSENAVKKAPVKRDQEKRQPRREAPAKRNQEERQPWSEAPVRAATSKQPPKSAWSIDEFQVPVKEGEVRFHDLDLPIKLMQGIFDLGFKYATPIQAGCLPETTKGHDAIGKAQTGTGKSAAFLITIIDHLAKKPVQGGPEKGFPRALILAPTRELALQIEKDARDLCKHTPYKILSLYGGTGYEKQKKGIAGSIDIIVATPGRLIDFKSQRLVDLSRIEILVIDEADRMLDMGFIPDIRKIVYATPHKDKRQTLFFSATYSSDVMRLAEQWTRDPHHMEIEPEKLESGSIDQKVFLVTTDEKFPLLYNLFYTKKLSKVLVFTNRRDQARRLAERLNKYNIKTDLLSGEVAQNKRIRALEDFRSGKVEILVATDVAARGLHIDEISHVINYHLPQDAEHYVHRIGRTGRAGATGTSVSFACEDDSYYIPAIEELLGHKLECEYPEEELLARVPAPPRRQQPKNETENSDETVPRQSKPRPTRGRQQQNKGRKPQEQRPPKEAVLPGASEEAFTKPKASDVSESAPEAPVEVKDETVETPAPERRREPRPRTPRPRRGGSPRGPKSPKKAGEAPMPDINADAMQPEPEEAMSEPTPQAPPKEKVVSEPKAKQRKPVTTPEPARAEQPKPEALSESPKTETQGNTETAKPQGAIQAKPRSPRPTRNTRTPHAPKYRKRPGNRYSKTTRKES